MLVKPSLHGFFIAKFDVCDPTITSTERGWEVHSRDLRHVQGLLLLAFDSQQTAQQRTRTPFFASPKKSRNSVSVVVFGRRMNNVQGFRACLRLVGVRAPVLSVRGLNGPPSEPGAGELVSKFGLGGPVVDSSFFSSFPPSLPTSRAASRSAWSRSLRSFLLALCLSAFSRLRSLSAEPGVDAVADSLPFTLTTGGVSLPDAGSDVEGGPCEGDDGSCSLSAEGAGVDDLRGVFDVPVRGGNDGLVEVGVGWVVGVAVRR